MIWNQRGGYDVTDALLRAHPGNPTLLGYSDAAAMFEFQESATRIAFRIWFGFVVILLAAMGWAIWYFSTTK